MLKKLWVVLCDRCQAMVPVNTDDLRETPAIPKNWFTWDGVKPPQHLCPECLAKAVEDSAPTGITEDDGPNPA